MSENEAQSDVLSQQTMKEQRSPGTLDRLRQILGFQRQAKEPPRAEIFMPGEREKQVKARNDRLAKIQKEEEALIAEMPKTGTD